MRGSRAWVLAAALWTLVIVVVAVVPSRPVLSAAGDHEDMVASLLHFAEYAVLAFVLAVAVDDWRLSVRAVVWPALFAVGLGWGIEVLQVPLSYRDFQVADGLVDAAGVAAGLAAFSVAAGARASRRRWRRG